MFVKMSSWGSALEQLQRFNGTPVLFTVYIVTQCAIDSNPWERRYRRHIIVQDTQVKSSCCKVYK